MSVDSKLETLLEIVELENGDLAIRRAEEDGEPLMVVAFSDELRDTLDEKYVDVGRMMLTAGVQMVAESGYSLSPAGDVSAEPQPTIH
ncbi:hypothetical protein QKW35_11355 [Pontibacterium granulatum]|uniref:hypothetical protein n=1 Tax=Pontibacterium granulatum TaxID=2036029 RepID=UPI00249A40B9|nr:hypothetical protein [Pontibacterium granulatum]MDI3324976.1 hypothetical protein [Pontibacterium granulatum]